MSKSKINFSINAIDPYSDEDCKTVMILNKHRDIFYALMDITNFIYASRKGDNELLSKVSEVLLSNDVDIESMG